MKAMDRLAAANPIAEGAQPPADLLVLITSNQPAPLIEPVRRRTRRFTLRGLFAILAALVLLGGVSWAATGVDPVDRLERLWGIDRNAGVSVDATGYGLEEFGVLEPMTEERFDEMPEMLKFWLAATATRPERPPPGALDGNLKHRMIQSPREIAGWGLTTTDDGRKAAVVSMNGWVCIVFDSYRGGSCGPLGRIERKGLSVVTNPGSGKPRWMLGLVTDEVASLRFERPGFGPIVLKDNVFDVTGLPEQRSFILGLDEDGKVVTRIFVSRKLQPRGGD